MVLDFICNVCGGLVRDCPIEAIGRETRSCPRCGSAVRTRSVVHLLSLALFGRSIPLPDFPEARAIRGIGLTDWPGYAVWLAEKFDYTNTYLHREPRLDITEAGAELQASCDFVIASDVFEHVVPPVERAFAGAFRLLKPGGHLILTVPYTLAARSIEHFPQLAAYQVVRFGERSLVIEHTAAGGFALHTDPVFHGGDGDTLEMRMFCEADVLAHLGNAGFVVCRCGENEAKFGILHEGAWSLPIVARRPF